MVYKSLKKILFYVLLFCISLIGIQAFFINEESPSPKTIYSTLAYEAEPIMDLIKEQEPIAFKEQEPEATGEVKELTLLSFNMRSARDEDGAVMLETIIDELKESKADIIGLQEVECHMPRTSYVDQVKRIADELDYYFYYGDNLNILGARYGNAILSKYPILGAENHRLPRVKLEPRGLIEAQIDIDGFTLNVYVTHIGLSAQERMKQVPFIYDIIKEVGHGTILMGDFNNRPDSPEMETIKAAFIDGAKAFDMGDEPTYSLYDGPLKGRLDRFYLSDDLSLLDYYHMPSEVSDHSRIIIKIKIDQ